MVPDRPCGTTAGSLEPARTGPGIIELIAPKNVSSING
jgi:hypothetical protein